MTGSVQTEFTTLLQRFDNLPPALRQIHRVAKGTNYEDQMQFTWRGAFRGCDI